MTQRQFVTSGDIMRRLAESGYDLDLGDVSYALRRLKIRPMAVAGITRLFPVGAVEAVQDFLAAKRGSKNATVAAQGAGR